MERDIRNTDAFIQHKTDYLNLDKLKIPAIKFNGSVSDLAIVFENLNRTGKKLSKYQVFAAQWSSFDMKLSEDPLNKEILKIVIDRYKGLIETREIEIENFDEETMMIDRVINLSELCYAVGVMVIEKMPLFWESDNEDLANQIGYSTIAMVLGISNKKLEQVIDKIDILNNADFIEDLVGNILKIYEDINSRFEKHFKVPGRKSKTYFGGIVGTDFQIMSYFAALWNTRFGHVKHNNPLTVLSHSSNKYKSIEKNLLKHFIMDSVTSKWAGSGDTKLDHIAVDQNNPYVAEVDKQSLENQLIFWYDEILKKSSINFEKTSRMLYTVYCSFHSDKLDQDYYDSEHVIPRYYINKIKEKTNIPGGVLGNLMYLDTKNNRSKGHLSLYDALKSGHSLDTSYFQFQMYPEQKAFETIKSELESSNSDYSNIKAQIKNRGKDIITSLIKELYPNNSV